MNRFLLNLAQLCGPLIQLLSEDTSWQWKPEHDNAFQQRTRYRRSPENNTSKEANLSKLSVIPATKDWGRFTNKKRWKIGRQFTLLRGFRPPLNKNIL